MKKTLVMLAATIFLCSPAAPIDAAESGWKLRVFIAGIDPDLSETVVNDDGDDIRVTGDSALGMGVSLEYQFSNRLGVDLGIMSGAPNVKLSADIPEFGQVSFKDSMSTTIVNLDLLVHLTPSSPTLDFYVGAGAAKASYGDLNYNVLDVDNLELRVDDDLTWSARAGIDISFGSDSKWAAFGGLRYMPSQIKVWEPDDGPNDSETFDYNIFNFNVGLALRF